MQEQKYNKENVLKELKFDVIVADEKKSNFRKYQEMMVGKGSLWDLVRYEFLTFFFGSLSNAPGLFLRKYFYPGLFQSLGKGVLIGTNVTLRQPKKITIGTKTIIDDFSVLSARGAEAAVINIGKQVLIGRGAHIRVKEGRITIGDFSRIGPFSFIGTTQTTEIGRYFTTGPLCIIGLLTKSDEDPDIPNAFRTSQERGGVIIEDNVAFGGNVTVLDGVRIGRNSVIGAGAVVAKDIPEFTIAYGVPAKAMGKRFS